MSNLGDELEELEMGFEAAMVNATSANLLALGEGLLMTDFTDTMRKSEMMKALRIHVQKSWGEDTGQQVEYMKSLHDTLATLREPSRTNADEVARQRELEAQERVQFAGHSGPLPDNRQHREHPQGPANADDAAGLKMFELLRALADANIAQRRQLKIMGIIGDIKDSKSINYINLMSQVSDARASNYKDDEIARAIKKAISASSNLRTYFDASETMDLNKMLTMLRDFYQEKSASELFHELGQLCQSPQEKSTDFLLRAMQMRQRTTAAAVAEGNLYNDKLVQGTFTRTVKTGLREESIRAQLAPHLGLGKSVDDGVLLREANQAELEHLEKTKKQKNEKRVTIAQATASAPSFDEALKPILQGMTTLQRRLDEMQSKDTTVSNNPQRESSRDLSRDSSRDSSNNRDRRPANRTSRQTSSWGGGRCTQCQRDDLPRCWHCFNCGAAGHFAIDCTASKN